MKQYLSVPALALSLALSAGLAPLAAPPLYAQETAAPAPQGWLEWGMSLFGDTLMQEVAPAIDDMKALAQQFGPTIAPAVERLMSLVDDMTNYELPEIQPNGDILIRRKPDAPAIEPAPDTAAEQAI